MGNQGKFTKKQSRKTNVFLYISVLISHSGDETYTAGGETPILGLLAFLSRSTECCGHTNLFYSQNRMIRSSLSRSSHKNNVFVTLVSRLMPNSIDSKTLVNTEKGFLYFQD